MEEISNLAYNRHIHLVLKAFQGAAMHSLRGPSRYSATWADPTKMSATDIEEYKKVMSEFLKQDLTDTSKSSVSIGYQQLPFLFPMDNSRSEKSETTLEGETISCFVVGGEKRLCLPQVLNLLRPFSMDQVYEACNELHIFFSRCNAEQLHILKVSGILPQNAQNCGLITKTDAERLCHRLLYSCPEKSKNPTTPNSFKVYHECFGKCKGIFIPELYQHPKTKCIQCCDCEGVFSPPNFVCHSHKSLENRTCHWGFDSANWRSYLLLAKEQDHLKEIEKQFEEIKSKFDLKRKESSDSDEQDKKAKYDRHSEGEGILQQLSVLAPWKASLPNEDLPAFLQQRGPPVILNPERVVPFSSAEQQRDSNHFAPNVSLAPASHQKPASAQQKLPTESAEDLTKHSGDITIDTANNNKRRGDTVPNYHPCQQRWPGEKDNGSHENVENDLSTSETDAVSSNSDSGVSTPTEKCKFSQPSLSESICEREQELKMLRLALDGRVGETVAAKDEFIEDFMRLRIREDIRMRQLENAKRDLQKELEFVKFAKKQKIQELTEAKKALKREVERLRIERDVKAHELVDERKLTKQQIDVALNSKMPNVLKLKAYYKSRMDGLKTKLNQHEQMHIQMCEEIDLLREQLRSFGKDVPDIKYEIAADDPSLMAALNSPLETKGENCFRFIVKDETVESGAKKIREDNEERDDNTSTSTEQHQENRPKVRDEWKIPLKGEDFLVRSDLEISEYTELQEPKIKSTGEADDDTSA